MDLDKDGTGDLEFARGNEIPEVHEEMNRRELLSTCGKLVGYYPVAGWLRTTCSYMKRTADGIGWEDRMDGETVVVTREIVKEVRWQDPVRMKWHVLKSEKSIVWYDASSMDTGMNVEIDSVVVKNATWLRKKSDYNHINVAKLNATIKGVKLALEWGLKEIEIRTNSLTVCC